MPVWVRVVLAAFGMLLVGCGADGRSASASEVGAAKGCASSWLGAELPAGSTVELLVASGDVIPAARWPAYRAMALAVATCAGEGSTVTLRPITSDSLTQLPLFAGTVPAPTGQNAVNPLRYRADVRGFAAKTAAAVDRLPELGKTATGSDPLGALQAAGEDLRLAAAVPAAGGSVLGSASQGPTGTPRIVGAGSQHVVVAIFNGWQQSRALNLFRYQHDPASSTDAALRSLRASGALPELHGSDVVIVGLTPGAVRMQTSDAQLAGLCRFWRSVIDAGHGTLKLCAAGLPGISQGG